MTERGAQALCEITFGRSRGACCVLEEHRMEDLAKLAESIAALLKERRETVAVSEIFDRRPDLGSASRRPGSVRLLPWRGRGVHAACARCIARHHRRADDWHAIGERALCEPGGDNRYARGIDRRGVSPRPVPPARRATAMAMPPATPASPLPGLRRASARWRPVVTTVSATCTHLRSAPWKSSRLH